MMTILELQAQKRGGKVPVIRIPSGAQLPVGVYVAAWKRVKTGDPKRVIQGFGMFDWTAGEVLDALAAGTNDRVNLRGGLRIEWREPSFERIQRNLRRTVKCECRWCGSPLAEYQPMNSRFCESSCQRSYFS